MVAKTDWKHPYTRELAAFPVATLHARKFWPPVARVNAAAGDRHLVCACPPIESYESRATSEHEPRTEAHNLRTQRHSMRTQRHNRRTPRRNHDGRSSIHQRARFEAGLKCNQRSSGR
jgi:hypothetical protein